MALEDNCAHAQGGMSAPSKTALRKAVEIQKERHKTVCHQRKARERNQRIQSILDATRKVVASKGYFKSTMDEIAMAAEITKPTIYLYFKNKDDLLLTLVQPLIDDIQSGLEIVHTKLLSGKIKDGGMLITGIFRVICNGQESSPEAFRIVRLFQQRMLFCKLQPEIRSPVNGRGRIIFDLVRSLLAKGMAMGFIKKVDVSAMAYVIWGVIIGVIQLEDFKADEQKSRRLKKNTLRLAQDLMVTALTDDTKKYWNSNHRERESNCVNGFIEGGP